MLYQNVTKFDAPNTKRGNFENVTKYDATLFKKSALKTFIYDTNSLKFGHIILKM